jgi:CheY-like chemotaxis protein
MKAEKKKQLFQEFLKKNKVLIVDKSSASRRRLVKTLVDMGSKRNLISSVAHYSEAIDVIKSEKPKLVLSDFRVAGGSGFDLFKEYRQQEKKLDDTVLILITSNISQSAVAKAAEEDVDSFIIKPYTMKSLEKSLITATIGKLFPSEYIKLIEAGKEKMFGGNYEEALEIFEQAKTKSKKPSLAMFYHGQTKYFMQQAEEAKGDYKEGLAINNIHFKCQIGLYELLVKQERYSEAYDVVRNIAKYFPANPDRLKEVVRLAIRTGNFEHMEEYYELFTELEERDPEVTKYICSGLYVSGKYYLFDNQKSLARTIFDKVAISCEGSTKFLKEMIKTLSKYELYSDCKNMLKRFPSSNENVADYMISSYLANLDEMNNTERISQGLELFNNGHKDPVAADILIKALYKDGNKRADEYLEEAQHLWPDEFPTEPKKPKAA